VAFIQQLFLFLTFINYRYKIRNTKAGNQNLWQINHQTAISQMLNVLKTTSSKRQILSVATKDFNNE